MPAERVIPRLIRNDIQVELFLIISAIKGKSIKALNANNKTPNTFSITLKLIIIYRNKLILFKNSSLIYYAKEFSSSRRISSKFTKKLACYH